MALDGALERAEWRPERFLQSVARFAIRAGIAIGIGIAAGYVTALSALMLALFSLALIVPFLRSFYELSTPAGDALVARALGTGLGVGGMLLALRLLRV